MALPQQTKRPAKVSEYGAQLAEKQKLRNDYGLREKQFRRYYQLSAKLTGQTGLELLRTLERRLDNVIYRAGMALSRKQARQLASHRHFKLNDKRVSIPSLLVDKGDVITLVGPFKIEERPEIGKVSWLSVDRKHGKITINHLPDESDLPISEFDTQKVIEFYSR